MPLAKAVDLDTSAFVSLVAGKVLSGDTNNSLQLDGGFECPCFIGDYASAGVYEGNDWDIGPDSRAGVQLDARFDDAWTLTTQLVGHGGNDMKPELSALALSWQVNEHLTANLGRQRLPLFYFSDFYDVGYAYPWIRVPTDLYGWPISSYNGGNVVYSNDLGAGSYRLSLLAGEEKDNKDRMYSELYYYSRQFVTHWKDMVGVSASYYYDWFDIRLTRMTNRVYAYSVDGYYGAGKYMVYNYDRQNFTGLAFNVDYNNFLFFTEGNIFDMPGINYKTWAKLVSVGYRIGQVTPMLSYSRYDDTDPVLGTSEYRTSSLSVRWNVVENMDIKFQYDRVRNESDWGGGYVGFLGHSQAIAVGVDYVYR